MYFTDTPSLNSMGAIMQKAPHLIQRGEVYSTAKTTWKIYEKGW